MAATGSGHVNHINSAIKPQEHHCLHYCPAVKQTLEGSLETSEWPERSGKYAEEGKRERGGGGGGGGVGTRGRRVGRETEDIVTSRETNNV